jgi:hypothetical protein
MAKFSTNVNFKHALLDLEEGTITEFTKEDTKTYRILDELRKFEGSERFIDLTIKEAKDIPSEEE